MSIRCILSFVLTPKILGFLDDGPLHGYELRRRIVELDGPGSHLSDGALYPALAAWRKPATWSARRSPEGGAACAAALRSPRQAASAYMHCCAIRTRRR